MPHTIIDDSDIDLLIGRLGRPLAAADRAAFDTAARAALADLRVPGAGSNYRCLKDLQRAFRDPPTDHRASWDIEQELGPSKLRDGPPIEHGDLRRVRRKHAHAR